MHIRFRSQQARGLRRAPLPDHDADCLNDGLKRENHPHRPHGRRSQIRNVIGGGGVIERRHEHREHRWDTQFYDQCSNRLFGHFTIGAISIAWCI